jgi:hypothetical protein
MPADMDQTPSERPWMTYREAAAKLGVSSQAVRQKCLRGRWPRMRSNTGQALIQLPDEPYGVRAPSEPPLVDALREHIATLKLELERANTQLAAESARADKAIAAFEQLAQRLEDIAAARRPWWRRLVG